MMYSRRVNNSSFQWFVRRIYSVNEDTISNNSVPVVDPTFLNLDLNERSRISRRFGLLGTTPLKDYIRKISTQASSADNTSKMNRLKLEKSPYLLQHATNPIDWYPWGQEAFDKAKRENKVIFLSVGYSTCHWCHVMEKESFEDASVAEIMNKHFVSIKVDREERPDVDKLYMSFIQASVGGGGWPMSVFLSPNLEPLSGGTYFPAEDKYGRPGFKTILNTIAEQWNTKQPAMMKSGKHIVEILRRINSKQTTQADVAVAGEDTCKKCLLQLSKYYESDFGGFSSAPKFPQPVILNFLFHMYAKYKNTQDGSMALEMALHTLKKMAYGGIHDHVNMGFARYSVDDRWHVPHFEKMLYDQAQLAVSYCDAYVITKDEFYAEIVRDILGYVSRDLSHQLGGFYGAEDADSYPHEGAAHKTEGAFCVWEHGEIMELLTGKTENIEHSELFGFHYNVKEDGNVKPSQDPHGELLKKNVLVCFGSYETTAKKFGIAVKNVKEILKECHEILYAARQKRPKPHVDTKILTSWNGLMISGFARAGFALKEESYVSRAVQAAEFIRKHMFREDTTLLRCCYRNDDGSISSGQSSISGFLDDYAFLIRGLLDLYEATLDTSWLQWAENLQETQNSKFWDESDGGYFTSPEGDPSILIRGKEDQDGAEPSGNSVAVHNLIRLADYLERKDFRKLAERTLKSFTERLNSIPLALPEMASALLFFHESPTQIFIAGSKTDENTQALLDVVRSHFIPGRILAIADGPSGQSSLLYQRHQLLSHLQSVDGKSAAYVCRNFTCALPVTETTELTSLFDSCSIQERKA